MCTEAERVSSASELIVNVVVVLLSVSCTSVPEFCHINACVRYHVQIGNDD